MPSRSAAPSARLTIIRATDGLQLPSLLFEPAKPSKTIVVWLHGMGSSGSFYPVAHTNALAEALTDRGIAFLAMNNRGAGMLQGVRYLDAAGQKQKRLQGTTHELIAECVRDIDGAVDYVKALGYTSLYLVGHSTGANKVCLYNYLKPNNPFTGFVVYGGGDDTGMFYQELGETKFKAALIQAKRHVQDGTGEELAPKDVLGDYFSFQSVVDILDPDGGYNVFPFYESQAGKRLGQKPLFVEYKSIKKPTLVIYGEADEYCWPDAKTCIKLLQHEASAPNLFEFKLVPGADHGCFGHEKELARDIADWVQRSTAK